MTEKRQFERYGCNIRVEFDYFEGNPDEPDAVDALPVKGKGIMLDISKGGAFIVTSSRVSINMPMNIHFTANKQNRTVESMIVRTGLLKNNPADVVRKYSSLKIREDAYIAIKFKSLLEDAAELRA